MKEYNQNQELISVICNQCGKRLGIKQGMLMEGVLEVKQNFGYFSNKDGQSHAFDLCEACYDQLLNGFVVPVCINEEFTWQIEDPN